MHDIRAITLDLDDTLWAIEPVIVRAEEKLWQHLVKHHPRIAKQFSAADVHDIRESVMAKHTEHWHDFRYLRKKVLQTLAQRAGYGDEIIEPAFAVFDQARNDVELFPDVLPHLQNLAEDFTLIALTNGNANLELIGIRHLFSDVVTSSDIGVAKPARKIFDVAVSRSGFPQQQVLHVGDHPETDIEGARRAGLRTAWMNRMNAAWPQHLSVPDATVRSVDELATLLDAARRMA